MNRYLVTSSPSDSWALYGSIAVGSVMPKRNVPPGLPSLISTCGVSGQPADGSAFAPSLFAGALFSFCEHAVSTSAAAVRPAAARSHACFLIKLVPP